MTQTKMMNLPRVLGPTDMPDLRRWLLDRWRAGTALGDVFPDASWVRRTLEAAQLWWVEEDTCHLLAEAAPTIPDDTLLDMTAMPTPAGFAVFVHDLEGIDAGPPDGLDAIFNTEPFEALRGRPIRVSAILWGPVTLITGEGIAIGSFSRHVLDEGLDPEDLQRTNPTLNAVMADLVDDPRPRKTTTYVCTGDLFTYLGRSDWLPGTGPADRLPDDPADDVAQASKAEDRRLLAALWAITRTPIVSTVRTQPPRPVRRRSERDGLSSEVRVLRLGGEHRENIVASSRGEGSREYRHQWIVSSHFRWQAHGKGHAERKLILIPAHRKGPEDAPLLGGDRVWRVVAPKGRGGSS